MIKTTKGSSMAKLVGLMCLSILLLVAMSACSSDETTESTPTPTVAAETPTETPTPTPRPTPRPLFLDVTSPETGGSVNTSEIEVSGLTLPTVALLSVNDQVVDVAADGTFSTTISLEEGINSIEVVVSSAGGEQENAIIQVAYIPE